MTSKENQPSRNHQPSVYEDSEKEKRYYGLRTLSDIAKGCKNAKISSTPFSKNGRTFRNLKSRLDVKGNSKTKKKLQKNCTIQKQEPVSSDVFVNEFIQEADFTNLTNMEDDAFQLAKLVESSDPFDQIIDDSQKTHTPDDASPSESSIAEMKFEGFSDISVKELEVATSDQTSGVAPQNRTPNQATMIRNNVGSNSKRDSHVYAKDCSEVHIIAPRNDFNQRSSGSNFSKSSLTVHRTASNVAHQNIFKEPEDIRKSRKPIDLKETVRDTPYTTLSKNVALKRTMFNLFNRPCYNYMSDRCVVNNCKWNHNLPPTQDLAQKLMRMTVETIAYMYFNFVLRTDKAFVTYFPTMCEVLGRQKMDSILLDAISECEKRKKFSFLKFIFNGLLLTGSSKRGALTMLTNHSCKNREFFDVLLEIIIETDALYFIDMLKKYYLYGTISIESMHKLLQQVIDAPGTGLLPVFMDVLDKYSMYSAFDVETFKRILPTVKDLVEGDLSLAQQLNHIARRMQ